jgi:protein TonB
VASVACAHIAALWLALQVPAVRQVVRPMAALMVDLVAPPQPDRPAAPPPRPAPPMRQAVQPRPSPPPILAAPLAESVAPTAFAVAPTPAEPAPVPSPAAISPAAPAPIPAPPARRVVAATAVQYRVLPPVEVPRASRRAGESGMVWLKVVVSVTGLPTSVVVHRSSGFPRLDEQAVWAMRQARFKPQTEDGSPIELEVTAPIEYLLE